MGYYRRVILIHPAHAMFNMSIRRRSFCHRRSFSSSSFFSLTSTCLSSEWQRVTLPLPFAVLQQDHIRFRISVPAGTTSLYSNSDDWAIEKGSRFVGTRHTAETRNLCLSVHRSVPTSVQWSRFV